VFTLLILLHVGSNILRSRICPLPLTMNRCALLSSLACLLFLVPSCKDMTQGKGLAAAAMVDFHKQYNDQKFTALYADSHPQLKAAATEADFVKLLEAMHRKLGKHVKSTESGWRVNSHNFTTYVISTQNSEYEQGKGTETFTYIVSDGACKLQTYHINSQDMLTK
jgi:hypothetical protein